MNLVSLMKSLQEKRCQGFLSKADENGKTKVNNVPIEKMFD